MFAVAMVLGAASAALLAMELFSMREQRRRGEQAAERLRSHLSGGARGEAGAVSGARGASGAHASGAGTRTRGARAWGGLQAQGRSQARRAGLFSRAGRRASIETQLPEMIDVVSLGLEGGMSFRAAFSLYVEKFDTPLAHECLAASKVLSSGIEDADKVLKGLSDRLGSKAFGRFADVVCRSLRFGNPMTDQLGKLAGELRRGCEADFEEAIAKAPTKMLLPMGVLILPAMLILVAGPFLVEIAANL